MKKYLFPDSLWLEGLRLGQATCPTSAGLTSATRCLAAMDILSINLLGFSGLIFLAFQVHQCQENVNQSACSKVWFVAYEKHISIYSFDTRKYDKDK